MIDYFNVSDDSYILTLDSRHFDETILIDKNERIVPIKLRKIKKKYWFRYIWNKYIRYLQKQLSRVHTLWNR